MKKARMTFGDTSDKQHRRHNDEKVVEDKVDEVIRILFSREGSCNVPYHLENQTNRKGHPPPAAVLDGLRRVVDEVKKKPRGCEGS
jgi:hypothetical protein